MKEIETFLKTISDGLKSLAKRIDMLSKKVDNLAKTEAVKGKAKVKPSAKAKPAAKKKPATSKKAKPAAKKAKAPAAPKKKASPKSTSDATAFNLVMEEIGKSKDGMDTTTLIKTTGFNAKKIANIIYKAKKRGMIQAIRKGVYAKM